MSIGFHPQATTRRPIYSVTGEKLCYLVSGPDGEYVCTLKGRRSVRLTKMYKAWTVKLAATTTVASGLMLYPEEHYEW